MRVASLALRTTLDIQRSFGLVEDKGDYIVLRTPSVPDYWYGNCIAMPGPPADGDLDAWERLFRAELPGCAHRVFLVDGIDGDMGAAGRFEAAGYEARAYDVLSAEAPRPAGPPAEGVEYRPFISDSDWAAGVETSRTVNAGSPGYSRGYVERSFSAARRAVERGDGLWWGAWDGDIAVGQMGLFIRDGLARFRNVETHPDYRRRGICRSLLFAACDAERRRRGGLRFVIVPEDGSVRRIYESVGFGYAERTVDFCRKPPEA
ncbi:MAG: hypothetical protein CVV47_10640 [Spirochaetae bacterium HGW-Spirochaetae-3]|jgi:ribosomal protein S18 acetylase RimI-like enzyme|nr:MAG: hypothetical protein CVV47_10640 [Spirochaetae bacterium HGW-Spirochaetae-3]